MRHMKPADRERAEAWAKTTGSKPPGETIMTPTESERMRSGLDRLLWLCQQGEPNILGQAALVSAYVSASRHLPADSAELVRLRERLAPIIANLASQRLTADDPRIAPFQAFLAMSGNDANRAALAEALVASGSGLPANHELRQAAWQQLAVAAASSEQTIRDRATAAFARISTTDTAEIARVSRALLNAAIGLPNNNDARARFWSNFGAFLQRTGQTTGELHTLVAERMLEYRLPGQGDAVADNEQLAQAAVTAGNFRNACTFFERALEARRTRDGANNIDLAQARLRYALYREGRPEPGPLDARVILQQRQLAADAFRQQQPPTLDGANALRLLGDTLRHHQPENFQTLAETAYADAVRIYGANATGRNETQYGSALNGLITMQLRNNHVPQALASFNTLEALARQNGLSATDRATILSFSFERAAQFIGTAAIGDVVTLARNLRATTLALDFSQLPPAQIEGLRDNLLGLGRYLNEGGRAADSCQFFETLMTLMERTAPADRPNYNLANMLDWYIPALTASGQTERATQLRERARQIRAPRP